MPSLDWMVLMRQINTFFRVTRYQLDSRILIEGYTIRPYTHFITVNLSSLGAVPNHQPGCCKRGTNQRNNMSISWINTKTIETSGYQQGGVGSSPS
jgi:hypothetical protein